MIHLSKLLLGGTYPGDKTRFPELLPASAVSPPRPPVVVWHMTGSCNLQCRHCYASEGVEVPAMPHEETRSFLSHLARLDPPSLLLSGGEPMTHPKFFDLLNMASDLGLRLSLSTNGTLIDASAARSLKDRVGYVGVSLDGLEETHDAFRGTAGAFQKTLSGIENLRSSGVRVGLRFTMARPLLHEISDIMKLSEELGVDRICFYHFIPSGRGNADLTPARSEIRSVLDALIEWVDGGKAPKEVLTVGNFSDGVLLYLRLLERGDARAEKALSLIKRGKKHGIVSVRWDGMLFADQFSWRLPPLGRWQDLENHVSASVGAIPAFGGRCGTCRWRALCRGNMRARAAAAGNPLGEDPGCVLMDGEIA